ncbi:MAG: patatin-like phospholipase family protein [Calditrichaeota bacterium]|nr:patatin-like phospholipase family protein [Calditrichota bacterium]MCB0268170.1 patatin-like phospholipase family protein [Calditrichota bacterium]MCB0286421.1 patatin-like phospholipase family protein [Calditrichota bacterium]
MKVALVLSGGGARGLAHVGVLKALEKANIKIDMIVGCSFGAIIGGIYAQNPDYDALEARLNAFMHEAAFRGLGLDFLKKSNVKSDDTLRQFANGIKDWVLMNLIAKKVALLKAERLEKAVESLIAPGNIEDTKIPFACNATDLISGSPFLFAEGDMRKAITASATIPGYFPPVSHENRMLVDGAITYNLPIRHARNLGADFIIAVDVHPILHPELNFKNVFEVILRSKTITSNTLSDEIQNSAEVLIQPPIREYYWYEFDRYVEIIKAGEETANLQLEDIKHEIKVRSRGKRRIFTRQRSK